MQILSPAYYHSFRCLAAACPDSCCKEWAVQIDDDSAQRYRSLPGELGDALRQALTIEDGDTILALAPDRRCPMWQDNRLCRIQAELGEDWLCHTCRQFPRLRHDYGDFVELGLELSCPEAARLILSDSMQEIVTEQLPGGDTLEYDATAMAVLRRSRETALHFLHSTDYPVGQALAILLLYGHAVQNELDGGEEAIFDPAALLAEARSLATGGSMDQLLEFFSTLEILTQPGAADWHTHHPPPGVKNYGPWPGTLFSAIGCKLFPTTT